MIQHSKRFRLIVLSSLATLAFASCAGYVSVRLAGDSIKPGTIQRSGEARFAAAPRLLASAELDSSSLEIRVYRDDEAVGESLMLTPEAAKREQQLSGEAGLWSFDVLASGSASGGAFEAELSDR